MAWFYLAIAAGFEILFAMSMKLAEGFTRPLPSLGVVLGGIGGLGFLTLAIRDLPVSVAYPIWTGVGTMGTVLFGFALLGETLTAAKLVSVAAIVAGVIGLKLSGE